MPFSVKLSSKWLLLLVCEAYRSFKFNFHLLLKEEESYKATLDVIYLLQDK